MTCRFRLVIVVGPGNRAGEDTGGPLRTDLRDE